MPKAVFASLAGNGQTQLVNLRDTDEELRLMRAMIEEWRNHPDIRKLALEIIKSAGIEPKAKKRQALAIGSWVQRTIYYVHEFPERLQTPLRTLADAAGDCDDSTMLVGALLESIGIPAVMVCMKLNGEWAHIFPAAVIRRAGTMPTLLPLDTTLNEPISQVKNPIEKAHEMGKTVALKLA